MKAAILFGVLAIGCGDNGRDISGLREAIAESRVSIHDMVSVAETSMQDGRAITAEMRLEGGGAVYAYGTVGDGSLHDIHVDTIGGTIVASRMAGAGSDNCPGSISIAEAIAIAEAQIEQGTVIAAIPDDDVACAREIQVLAPDLLWEVKVAGDGGVLEVEESDENED